MGVIFRIGDRIMQTKNNYDMYWERREGDSIETGNGVFNGEIGTITNINEKEKNIAYYVDLFQREFSFELIDTLDLDIYNKVSEFLGLNKFKNKEINFDDKSLFKSKKIKKIGYDNTALSGKRIYLI